MRGRNLTVFIEKPWEDVASLPIRGKNIRD
jgi:hypothetical protein